MTAPPDRRGSALARVAGVDPDCFSTSYWARAPLLSRGATLLRDFTDLLTLDAVDEIVSRRGLRTPFVRMAQDGDVLDPGRYTAPGGAGAEIGDQVAGDKVAGLVVGGATLVLQGMHRFWPPVIDLATALAAELGHPVQVNAYITPPQAQGFAAHYDVHDVFVLQAAGRKRWSVHEPVLAAPLRDQPWSGRRAAVAAAALAPPALDAVLASGDALYLPRGWLHSAQALGETSVHLTVGVQPVTRHELVQVLTELVSADPILRASLPIGLDVSDPAAVAPVLDDVRGALAAAVQQLRPEDVADRLRSRVWPRSRPAPLAPFAQAAAVAAVDARTVVRRRDALSAAVRVRAERVVIVLPDREVAMPVVASAAVAALLSGADWAAGELPGLDAADAVVVVRRLLLEGVVVAVPAP